MKYQIGEKVYVKCLWANDLGLVEGLVEGHKTRQLLKQDVIEYRVRMLNYYKQGNHSESHIYHPSSLFMFEHAVQCTEDYLVPFGEAAKVLYGKKPRF